MLIEALASIIVLCFVYMFMLCVGGITRSTHIKSATLTIKAETRGFEHVMPLQSWGW